MVNSRRSLENIKVLKFQDFQNISFSFFFCFLYQYINKIISLIKKATTLANQYLHLRNLSMSTTTTHNITTPTSIPRAIARAIPSVEQDEGVGARVRRSIGNMAVRNFTPFLMLDHFRIDPSAGFPDHPHRGQETITYVLKGNVDHEDFTGSKGTLGPGDLQFMTAGRGIVHAEMPRIDAEKDGNLDAVEGLQLWVDLPAKLKACEPRYRDLRANEIPVVTPNDKVTVKVISGQSYGVDSVKDLAYTPVWMLDFTVLPGGSVKQKVPHGFNTFLYSMDGEIIVEGRKISKFTNIFFDTEGDEIHVSVPEFTPSPAQFVIVAGEILHQEIVQHGPFVETSFERILKAFMDYSNFTNGFERAKGWASEIGKRMLF